MENECMKKCPYCAELIRAEAVKCRYCGSNLTGRSSWMGSTSFPQYWQRVREGKIIAGVCTGIARQFDAPILVLPLRLFFLLTTIFYGFGLILYVILWILMPLPTDQLKTGAGTYAAPPPPPYQPPPPVREEPCPPAAGEQPPGEAAPEKSPGEEPSPEEPPRGVSTPEGPSPGNPPPEEPSPGQPADGEQPRGNSTMKNGMMLLLIGITGLFITFILFNNVHSPWGPHPFGHFTDSFFLSPFVEWIKLLLVAGVVLVILAGMGFVAIGIIPLALVAAGSVVFLSSMHVISARGIAMALLATSIILIIFSGMRLFRRQSKVMNNGA